MKLRQAKKILKAFSSAHTIGQREQAMRRVLREVEVGSTRRLAEAFICMAGVFIVRGEHRVMRWLLAKHPEKCG
jgi:hypothetical protein